MWYAMDLFSLFGSGWFNPRGTILFDIAMFEEFILSLEYVFIKINLLWLSITRTVNMFRRDGSIMARKPQELRNPKLFVGFLAELLGLFFVCICRNCCSKWHSSSLPVPSSQEVSHVCSFAARRFLNLCLGVWVFGPSRSSKAKAIVWLRDTIPFCGSPHHLFIFLSKKLSLTL